MTTDLSIFSSKTLATHIPNIHPVDGSHMHVSHVGQVSTSNVSLPDIYHIPTLTLNLISVGQLCELVLNVIFSGSGFQVQDPKTGEIFGIRRKNGRLF